MGSDLQNDNYCHFGSGLMANFDQIWPLIGHFGQLLLAKVGHFGWFGVISEEV